MTITLKLRAKASKKTNLHQLIIRINDGKDYRKEISMPLYVDKQHWIQKNKSLKETHQNYEDTTELLNKLKSKCQYALDKFNLKRFTRQQVIDHIQGKSNFKDIISFINSVIKENRKPVTYEDYREKYLAFEGVVSPDNSLTFEDFIVGSYDFFESYFKYGKQKVQVEGKWTKTTYSTRITAVQRLLDYAKDKRVISERIEIPKEFRKVEGLNTPVIAPQNTDIFNSIRNIRTVEQWLTLAQWVLMFNMRGLYQGDIVGLSQEWIIDKKFKKAPRKLKAIHNDEIYIRKPRSKTHQEMIIKLHRDSTLTLIQMIKNVVAYVYFPNRPEAVADINDWIGIYAYKQDTHTKLHSAVWGTRQRTIREKFNTRFKDARKSFSTTLKHFERENEISTSMGLFLRGRSTDAIDRDSYIDETDERLFEQLNNAHELVLERFGAQKLVRHLIAKLHELVNEKRYNRPKWLLRQSGVHKVGREYKVLVGFENNKPVWENIDKKYRKYFSKDQSTKKGYWADEETWFDTDLKEVAYRTILENKRKTQKEFVNEILEMEEKANYVKDIHKNMWVRDIEEKTKRQERILKLVI